MIRDRAGNPLNRDEYAVRLRSRLTDGGRSTGHALLTAAQAAVVARLLDELAGVYRGESLGSLAHELSVLLDSQIGEQD
jgi:ABC-type antimicrobial peptide transport system permease subunit